MTQPLIACQGVRKTYWRGSVPTEVLRGVEVQISKGEAIAVIGSSGAGKSTLLQILGTLDPPTEGSVLFEGAALYGRGDEETSRIRNHSIGFVFQFHHLLPEFSALENAMIPLRIRGERDSAARQKAERLLDRLGLSRRRDHRPAELSGGEQQRVAVARALAGDPAILFADEPTGNLGQENGASLMDLLFELQKERGMALMLVTHNQTVAARFPKILRMADGILA